MQNQPILIVGKNAKTGWRVERRLQAQGHATRGVSRSTTPAFDWQDERGWRAALCGVRSAYVTFYPDLAIPQAQQAIENFVALAAECGLQHLVLLSGRGEEGARRAEIIVQNSGIDWNIVRASWFMQNFSEHFMLDGIINGELMLPAGDTVEPFIDIDDIADVATACLTRPELRNRVFEVSGPRAMTFAECVDAIASAVGYPIKYTQIPLQQFIDALRAQAAPEPMLWLMRELFGVVFDGRNAHPVDGVMQALGRPATDFSEYVAKTVASGAWQRGGLLRQG